MLGSAHSLKIHLPSLLAPGPGLASGWGQTGLRGGNRRPKVGVKDAPSERAAIPGGPKPDIVLGVSFLESGIVFPRNNTHSAANLSSTDVASVGTSTR